MAAIWVAINLASLSPDIHEMQKQQIRSLVSKPHLLCFHFCFLKQSPVFFQKHQICSNMAPLCPYVVYIFSKASVRSVQTQLSCITRPTTSFLWTENYIPHNYCKLQRQTDSYELLAVVVCICDPSSREVEDQLKVILGHRGKWRPAWPSWDPILSRENL